VPLLHRVTARSGFPPTETALEYPNGLLAVSDTLAPPLLIEGYRRGIFPWFEEPQPVLWWSPDPRLILLPEEFHLSRSLRRTVRRDQFALSVDTCFEGVMRACAAPRDGHEGTWINGHMLKAYAELHRMGHAHSIEVHMRATGELVGGLYGVNLGSVFYGESMFSRASDASKVALLALVRLMDRGGGRLIDCQMETPHLLSLGARAVPRVHFERLLADSVDVKMSDDAWELPERCGELL
jgi:leucyl/phenylalanyl-tRNA--protein transferase